MAQVAGGIGFGAGLSVGILLATDVTRSEGWAGVARTSTTVVAAAVALPLARAAVRSGRRISLTTGWAVAALGSALLVAVAGMTPSAPATLLLVVGLGLTGAGSAASLQSRYAAVDLAPDDRRSRQLSLVVWSTTVGTVLGPNLGVPGEALSRALGLAPIAGAFVIATVMQLVAALITSALRPDPLVLAGRYVAPRAPGAGERPSAVAALRRAWGQRPSRLALIALCAAHTVMVAVMTMTPVHMDHHGASLALVGLTISLHVVGMFAFSPWVGAAADRFGRIPVLATGAGVLLLALLVAGTSGDSMARVTVGLVLIGVGWSCALVAGSALLTESVPEADRLAVQGGSDAAMNVAAAIGAAASGPLLGLIGFAGLSGFGAVLLGLALLLTLTGPDRRVAA
nr:MFS transporter [Nakamurella flavida]